MKILDSSQIRELDRKTIELEPVSSLQLMERAGKRLSERILAGYPEENQYFHIFCGPGNNGGDGFVIARLLEQQHRNVVVYCSLSSSYSPEAKANLDRLPRRRYLTIVDLDSDFTTPKTGIIVDALFGSGLTRSLTGVWFEIITRLNALPLPKIAIDIPSGLPSSSIPEGVVFSADITLSIQCPKLVFFQPETAHWVGKWEIVDIGLHKESLEELEVSNHLLTPAMIQRMIPVRHTFDHKGHCGHALLICGGYGKIGAAILAARSCLRSGVGRLTVHVPKNAYQVMATTVPEAMTEMDEHSYFFSGCTDVKNYNTIGIGCGLGQKQSSADGLFDLLEKCVVPLVMDADAINLLASNPSWIRKIPANSILTPHPGEYGRLFGEKLDSFERIEQQKRWSREHRIFIVYKQAYTCITTPDGKAYFNPTGNPGMATAGSGDVLTGMITGLLAQPVTPLQGVLTAVYLHGLAGDLAARKWGQHSMIAGDIVEKIGEAFCQTLSYV